MTAPTPLHARPPFPARGTADGIPACAALSAGTLHSDSSCCATCGRALCECRDDEWRGR